MQMFGMDYLWFAINVFTVADFYVNLKYIGNWFLNTHFLALQKGTVTKFLFFLLHAEHTSF